MKAKHIIQGMTTIAMLMTIGCADGQRQGNGSNGKGKRMIKNQGPGGKNTPGKTGDTSTTAGGSVKVSGDSASEDAINDTIAQLDAGSPADTIKIGTYQLVSTSSTFKFLMAPDFVQALVTTDFQPEQNFKATTSKQLASGLLSPTVTQPARALGVPFQVKVTGQGSVPTLTPAFEKVLTSTIAMKVTAVSLNDTWSEVNAAQPPELSLTRLLQGNGQKIDDGKGGTAEFKRVSLPNGDLRFVIQVEETSASPLAYVVYRSFYLTYRLKALDAASTTLTDRESSQVGQDLLMDAQSKVKNN
jgi:hypothetical protein